MARPKEEAGSHAAAWELYYALGADRSLAEVSRRTGKHIGTIQGWAKAFRWEERLRARERLVAGLVAQKAIEDEAQTRADSLKLCRAIQVRFAETLRNGTAIITAGDFERAVKIELLLRGKATERTELVAGPAFDKLIDLLSAVIEREVSDPALRQRLAIGFQEAAAGVGGNA